MNDHQVSVGTALVTTWIAWWTWVLGHIVEINEFLQFFVLVMGLITSVYAFMKVRRKP